MSKKTFMGSGLNTVLGEPGEKQQADGTKRIGRPVTQHKVITKSSQEGTKENETRATFIVNESLLDELKAMAYWDRSLIKDVIAAALTDAVIKYKKKNNGELLPIPQGKK